MHSHPTVPGKYSASLQHGYLTLQGKLFMGPSFLALFFFLCCQRLLSPGGMCELRAGDICINIMLLGAKQVTSPGNGCGSQSHDLGRAMAVKTSQVSYPGAKTSGSDDKDFGPYIVS